jgi:hypothetical protein
MSESGTSVQLIAFIIGMIPSVYFAYMVVKGIYHTLRQGKDEDL